MRKLLLFDIDGTLVTSSHDNRFEKAISNVHGIETKLVGDFQGYTDYLILVSLLTSEGWTEVQIADAMPKLLAELDKVHASTFKPDSVVILPGVRKLLDALEKSDCKLGLITGNLKPVAERKLEAVGIWDYFTVGGFGGDPHVKRSDLVTLAIKRASFENDLENVYVIGDTVRDISAAHDAGVINSVGVVNDFRDVQELIDAGAKIVFDNFEDIPQVLKRLGIE